MGSKKRGVLRDGYIGASDRENLVIGGHSLCMEISTK